MGDASSYKRSDYTYELPPELIATRPPAQRTDARLLVLDRAADRLAHTTFAALGDELQHGDLLVLNDTRVVPARLFGRRAATGGGVELLLVRRLGAAEIGDDDTSDPSNGVWEAMGRPGRKLRPGDAVELEDGVLTATVLSVVERGRRLVRIRSADGDTPVEQLIDRVGHMPIPPYLGRRDDARDRADYQTVFARVPGAVAAPTAGLHFSAEQLAALARAGVDNVRLTLHVGPGTFEPVATDDIRGHAIEPERYELGRDCVDAIERARAGGGRVVAVGTTVVRTLEACVGDDACLRPGHGATDLFIYPPFRFRVIDALITNFHLPESTLLMLVAAFAGRERILDAYRQAIEHRYLVYSYGDAMLIR